MEAATIKPDLQVEQEFRFLVSLEFKDRTAAIEAFRNAGFHAVELPRELPEDDFLLVTKHHRVDNADAIYDLVCSIIDSYGGEIADLSNNETCIWCARQRAIARSGRA